MQPRPPRPSTNEDTSILSLRSHMLCHHTTTSWKDQVLSSGREPAQLC